MTAGEGVKGTLKRIISMSLVGMLCLSSCVSALAESEGKINLQLDKSVYNKGQEVVLSTQLNKNEMPFPNGEVLLNITQVNTQKVVLIKQLLSDDNGACTTKLLLSNDMAPGKYSVSAMGLGTSALSEFQIMGGTQSNAVLETDKDTYRIGETVKIRAKLVVGGEVLAYHTALVKVYCGERLVCLKELVADEAGAVALDFVPATSYGTHSIQLTTLGSTFNKQFEVTKGSVDRMQYQLDGSLNKLSFKGGERLSIKGTAGTLKDGVKKLQGPIEVKLLQDGKVVYTKPVLVASNGKFYTEIILANRTADYEVVLINQSAEKRFEISVTKKKWF